ncbi:MAG TPA: DUF547 domain-containing protein [Thermoanaerobaculia bacterium]|nr:DUF547 domain-containing protein [Thermoanaerobaculia bacterium]
MNKKSIAARILLSLSVSMFAMSAFAGTEPDYSAWNAILTKHYNPEKGMDYKGLKATHMAELNKLNDMMGKVNVNALDRKQQQAYWMNYYNISVVSLIAEKYPLKSIRDLDGFLPYGVFLKDRVMVNGSKTSLKKMEDEKIRAGFKDPRVHFAINCAAKSCPPLRTEAYTGEKLDMQLDEQARKFLNGPTGVRIEKNGDETIFNTTKIMDWFKKDFADWGGGALAFSKKYLDANHMKPLQGASKVTIKYDDYSWALNDASK